MKILAIESSCDEAGVALVEATMGRGKNAVPQFKVLKHLVASQIAVHREFGGVVPSLAKRDHLNNLPILLEKFDIESKKNKPDLITVTVGPGLEPALWAGIEFSKKLSKDLGVPLIGANHLEGHLYSFLLGNEKKTKTGSTGPRRSLSRDLTRDQDDSKVSLFPAVALIVSGGHTILLKMDSLTKWKRLGETRDDAAGEAFDKVARMLELPYPGGPEIEKLAQTGNPQAIAFPRPMMNDKNYEFSFSGLKTAVLYYLRDMGYGLQDKFKKNAPTAQPQNSPASKLSARPTLADVAASFQQAATDVLVAKTIRAAKEFDAQSIILCGGVAANKFLRQSLKKASTKIGCSFFVPEFKYNLDNGAMIATAGYMAYLRKKKYPLRANGNMEI